MKRIFRFAIASLTSGALAFLGIPVALAESPHVWPISGPVVRGYDPPQSSYSAGHRGVDIGAPKGTPVASAADGVVTFVGVINSVPMITVTHGDIRTTYQPVAPIVSTGQHVIAGQVIGTLVSGHGATTSLHFGVLQGETYLDPLSWLGDQATQRVRLLPDGTKVPIIARAAPQNSGMAGGWPVSGPVTSGYGWRYHPILHTMAFHNGIDIGAACGTPVTTPWPGTVVKATSSASLGNYVEVANSNGITSTYAHLSVISVKVGAKVGGGQQIGLVGTTGLSTGCHLHFATARNGAGFDPRTVLP